MKSIISNFIYHIICHLEYHAFLLLHPPGCHLISSACCWSWINIEGFPHSWALTQMLISDQLIQCVIIDCIQLVSISLWEVTFYTKQYVLVHRSHVYFITIMITIIVNLWTYLSVTIIYILAHTIKHKTHRKRTAAFPFGCKTCGTHFTTQYHLNLHTTRSTCNPDMVWPTSSATGYAGLRVIHRSQLHESLPSSSSSSSSSSFGDQIRWYNVIYLHLSPHKTRLGISYITIYSSW